MVNRVHVWWGREKASCEEERGPWNWWIRAQTKESGRLWGSHHTPADHLRTIDCVYHHTIVSSQRLAHENSPNPSMTITCQDNHGTFVTQRVIPIPSGLLSSSPYASFRSTAIPGTARLVWSCAFTQHWDIQRVCAWSHKCVCVISLLLRVKLCIAYPNVSLQA